MIDERAAPVADRDGLARVMTEDIEQAQTLPAEVYLSEEVFGWEQRRFFEDGWVCVGRAVDVGAAGDQKTVMVGSESVVLVRGSDGGVRGFLNACPHRGHQLLGPGECANAALVRCPYHSWSFRLDGSLRNAPHFAEMPGFDGDAYGLVPVAVTEWNGWVFVNCSVQAPPFADWVGTMDELFGPWEIDRLEVGASHTYTLAANWKTVVENFLECYHCPSIHPELCRVSPADSAYGMRLPRQGWWLGGPMTLVPEAVTMSLSGESSGLRIRGISEDQARHVYYFALFPSVLISLHPDYVMVHRIEAHGPGQTMVECSWLFPPEALASEGFDARYAADFWDLTNRQDFDAVESVWRGMQSRGYRPGPFQYREVGVHAFMAACASGYLSGRLPAPREVELAEPLG